MSEALLLEFAGTPASKYDEVNRYLGLDQATGEGDWPAGLRTHIGATDENDNLIVMEIWDSQEAQHEFMTSRLGPALGKAEVPEPSRMQWLSVRGNHTS